jgi:anti-anti-sigma factor
MASSITPAINTPSAARADTTPARRSRSDLSVSLAEEPWGLLLRVAGAAHTADLDPLEHGLARVLARRPSLVVVDIAGLTLLSSLAMGLLVGCRRDLVRWGGRVRLAGAAPSLREPLEAARLAELFDFHGTVADAVAADAEASVEAPARSVVVVRPRGVSALETDGGLARTLETPAVQAARFVILDLADCSSLGGVGLQTLVELQQALGKRGGEVWLVGLQPAVWLALRRAGQDRRFAIRDSVGQALAS